ncbi:MAG: integrin alpha, partial [Candidatus Methylomirabilis sp.]|nr:integrin alpha [Deltaproteobacteria bacterium]
DIAVGAPGGDGNGRAFLYSGADGALIEALDGENWLDRFGYALSVSPDLDGDGTAELIVGAPHDMDDFIGPPLGRAYVYSGADRSLLLDWSGRGVGDLFGSAADSIGDVDGDGAPDIAIVSPYAAINPGSDLEAVRSTSVFSGADGRLLYDAVSPAYDSPRSVARIGDVDGDGIPDFLLPELYFNSTVRSGHNGIVIDRVSGALEGAPVGDLDQDGRPDFIVGARFPYGTPCYPELPPQNATVYSGAWASPEGLLRHVLSDAGVYTWAQAMALLVERAGR